MSIRWQKFVCITGVFVIVSCAGGKKIEQQHLDCTERMAKAIELFKAKKYSNVAYRLEDTRTQCNGSPVMDTVLYYLGMANLYAKRFVEARTEFQRLVQDFPRSPFFDEAKFRIGYAVLKQSNPITKDQQETREAMRLFDGFIESFPNSPFIDSAVYYRTEAYEKLAQKDFDNAIFYVNAKEPEAAVVYYSTFFTQYAESRLVDQARFNAIELLVRLDRLNEAVELNGVLATNGKNKALQKAAAALISKKKKGGGSPEASTPTNK